jgi:hypothetical protein
MAKPLLTFSNTPLFKKKMGPRLSFITPAKLLTVATPLFKIGLEDVR